VDYIINQSLKWHISSFKRQIFARAGRVAAAGGALAEADGLPVCAAEVHLSATLPASRKLTFTTWWKTKASRPATRSFPGAPAEERKRRDRSPDKRRCPHVAAGRQRFRRRRVRAVRDGGG